MRVKFSASERTDVHRYAEEREMTDEEFVRYCVRLYMNTTPLNPDELVLSESE